MESDNPKTKGVPSSSVTQPLLRALSVAAHDDAGRRVIPLQRFGPMLVAVAIVIVAVGASFGFVPGMGPVDGVALLGGAAGGYSIRSQA